MAVDWMQGELAFSTRASSSWFSARAANGLLRKIGPALYTSNLTDEPEAIIKRNLWQVVGGCCPGGVIADRTAILNKPSEDGSVFMVANRVTDIDLPGLKIRIRPGAGPTEEDRKFMGSLHLSCLGRAVLDNLAPSRARSGVARTLGRDEMEKYLDEILRRGDSDRLNSIRDQAKRVAPLIGREAEMAELDRIVGQLLGSREDGDLVSEVGKARKSGVAFDPTRIEMFENLRRELQSTALPVIKPSDGMTSAGWRHLAFFEAYFSNFIEGTEFEIDEAVSILFGNVIPSSRPEDAHDILGTFRIVSDAKEMARTPSSWKELQEILKSRHTRIMELRPGMMPGVFKDLPNRAGSYEFVKPDMVRGTLAKGLEIQQTLEPGFNRAVFAMFLVSETHPFRDGNGRLGRIMMNAELSAVGEQRIIVPTVYRDNYLTALRVLSNDGEPRAFVRMLRFAQEYGRSIPWSDFGRAAFVLKATKAFARSQEPGAILCMPSPVILRRAEAMPSLDPLKDMKAGKDKHGHQPGG